MQEAVAQLVREAQSKYYGKYRGFVAANDDPDKIGRLKLTVPSVLGTSETDWANPCLPFGGTSGVGLYLIPEPGAQVWVEFEEGDLSKPIWVGTFWSASGQGEADLQDPAKRTLRTPSGHLLQLDDTSDEAAIKLHHMNGAELSIDKDGTVSITDKAGDKVVLNAADKKITAQDTSGTSITLESAGATIKDGSGNEVQTRAAGITVKGTKVVIDAQQVALGGPAGEPVIKGSSFLTIYAAHMHPTAMGPSGPPVPMGEATSLSMKVMTS